MPNLPEKDYFRFLEADVVQKRRNALEEYVAKVVSSIPAVRFDTRKIASLNLPFPGICV